jgi:hypothetical protein
MRVHFCNVQKLGKQVKLVRDIVREIAGVSPLERRGMELLKNGRDKRVLKLCKKRVSWAATLCVVYLASDGGSQAEIVRAWHVEGALVELCGRLKRLCAEDALCVQRRVRPAALHWSRHTRNI